MLRRLVNNAAISFLGQIVTWGSTLALTVAYGMYLRDAQFGEFYFVNTLILLLGLPIGQNSGYNIQITRHLAERPDESKRILSNVLAIKAGWLGADLCAGSGACVGLQLQYGDARSRRD